MMTSGKIVVLVSSAVTVLSLLSIILLNSTISKPADSVNDEFTESKVRIAVFNGCGRSGLAGMFAEILRDEGFDVVNGMGENADSFDFKETLVVDRKGKDPRKAASVAQALGIKDIIIQCSDDPYIIEDVAVILGRDWHTLLKHKEEGID